MDLKRRNFIKVIFLGLGLLYYSGYKLLKFFAPKRVLIGEKDNRYPGGLKKFSDKELKIPSKWSG